ncbi:transposase [Microvirga arvi]|uniref:transposase n=1 Tax=Microvirga arvi TaxID=2778731 RepID=UPI003558E191
MAYDAALSHRGSLTVWVTEEAIAAWNAEPRTTRGGQSRYSVLTIRTALTLRVPRAPTLFCSAVRGPSA